MRVLSPVKINEKVPGVNRYADTPIVETVKTQPPICAQYLVFVMNLYAALMFPFFAFVHITAWGSQTKRPPGVVKARSQA